MAIALLAVAIWGASPPATAMAARDIPADIIGRIRPLLAAFLVLPLAFSVRGSFPSDRRDLVELLLGGACGFAIYPYLLTHGVAQTSVLHASIALASAPVFTGLLSFAIEKNWPRTVWWFGAVIAMIGVVVLLSETTQATSSKASLIGDLLVLASVFFASIGYVFGGRSSAKIGKWPATIWMLVMGGLCMSPFGISALAQFSWSDVSMAGYLSLGYLVICVSFLGYAFWFRALGAEGAARIAPLQFLQPFVGAFLAVLIFAEPISMQAVGALVLTLSGVMISTRNTG